MALSFATSTRFSKMQSGLWYKGSFTPRVTLRCCEIANEPPRPKSKLQVGSPIIIVEAPKVIKTAASMPCLRANSGLVKPGDVGRIVSRKPKDLWAVRLAIGTYLLDGKYFKALELEEEEASD
ncbi:Protein CHLORORESPIRATORY REDUCTION 42 [Cardamine amara subsp. amara]|uniref:Protein CHLORORESPIRATORY REDUCTION 42 n=1 Tax=Cardamine amara subsp. amara TaxID=228776 RepID=A0ABD0ZJL2_CARAN